MNYLYRYFLVGGMPANVKKYLAGESLLKIRKGVASIFDDYLNDMKLYQAREESIICCKAIFNNVYAELSRESKDFKASLLDHKWKNRDLKTPIDWLFAANILYKCRRTKEIISSPLKAANESDYRLYSLDLGLLSKKEKAPLIHSKNTRSIMPTQDASRYQPTISALMKLVG